MEILQETPRLFALGVVFVWQWLGEWVPHYSWAEYGSLLKGFVWLIPARVIYGILFPEKVVVKQFKHRLGIYRKRSVKPSKTDHQSASAALFEVFKGR